jgi:hypothetical protein
MDGLQDSKGGTTLPMVRGESACSQKRRRGRMGIKFEYLLPHVGQGPRPHQSCGGRWNQAPRDDRGGRRRNVVEDSLVNVTRPGYKTFSRSFSDEMPSTPFSPSGVAVDLVGAKGGEDETPSRVDREARVGLGCPLLPTGRTPGDVGLAKESSCSLQLSTAIQSEQKRRPWIVKLAVRVARM